MSDSLMGPSPSIPGSSHEAIHRIPSIELQTLAFIDFAAEHNIRQEVFLQWNGFHVHLAYEPNTANEFANPEGAFIHVLYVFVPVQFRRQGWFTEYYKMLALRMCGALACKNHFPMFMDDFWARYGLEPVYPFE